MHKSSSPCGAPVPFFALFGQGDIFPNLPPRSFIVASFVFKNAFSAKAVSGGLLGTVIRFGVARGVLSNETGLGRAPIALAASKIKDPVVHGIVASLGSFIDTLIVYTMTAMVIMVSGLLRLSESGAMQNTDKLTGAALFSASFNQTLPGLGGLVVDFGLIFFAFSTIWSRYYQGSKCCEYIAGLKRWPCINEPIRSWSSWRHGAPEFRLEPVRCLQRPDGRPNLIALISLSPVIFATLRKHEESEEVEVVQEEEIAAYPSNKIKIGSKCCSLLRGKGPHFCLQC